MQRVLLREATVKLPPSCRASSRTKPRPLPAPLAARPKPGITVCNAQRDRVVDPIE